jgi:hypothetical protein
MAHRQENRKRPALAPAQHVGPLESDRVHHGPGILHALFERWYSRRPVGEARATLVKPDESGEALIRSHQRTQVGSSQSIPRCEIQPGIIRTSCGPLPTTW